MARVAINGLGRIGRALFKIIQDIPSLELIAINDLVPPDNLAYLLNYDTVYGRYAKTVSSGANSLTVAGREVKIYSERDPAKIPWGSLDIDVVFECTGFFVKGEDLQKHLDAGAKRVILSAPTKSPEVPMVVHGVTEAPADATMFSTASCTTNCIAPVAEIMERRIGVAKAIMTTIHAYTATQSIVDRHDPKDFRRGRAGAANLVPASTGAAIATTKVLPHYAGKFDGVAVRVPTPVGSLSDLTFVTTRDTSVEELTAIFTEEVAGKYHGILAASADPIVSSDIIGDAHASIIDLAMTQVVDGNLVKIMTWYDNEWGYTNQMVREALRVLGA
ncbi:type I glyceraldehyde-3-phosphate dehydrogenase [Spirulina major CS-329]|uniref:type I glyceraldehyde-3-phosphate dehydrogenase n=1 Tax=Spirulina TaxID=1154 RepID=UPI002330ADC6|nr:MULTISPECIES: type I glyceraldehyde-3-phosphate dehydrogenase [Spirulina]MDB9496216.1 type I glyceraldehyde-3-phosphate dehydrogenase [Spirulina subsalsa CS-330]MDB9504262.1 type I glyceraldehyde-3-phosphate dehydrogenase [Spirulina major CS-329]